MPIGIQELGTFSQIVDDAIRISGRGKVERTRITGYARATMRECQVRGLFKRDFIETQITATADPHIWTVPADFRIMHTVRYPNEIYPHFREPGARQKDFDFFYYRATDYFALKGITAGDLIDLAYYSYFIPLVYFETTKRPARYFADLAQWQYLDGNGIYQTTLGTTALDDAAELLVSNWMLFHWYDTVLEGTIAKVFKINGDSRAPSSFALFKSMQKDIILGEVVESLGR